MLNKLRYHTHFQFSANQITWSRLLIQIHILNGKQCRSRSVGFFRSQLIWIYTVCKGRTYPGSAGQGLRLLYTWLLLTNEIKLHVCMQSRLFIATQFLSLSERCVKRVICKTWTGTLANNAECGGLIRVCTVCLNNRKLRVKWTVLSPFRTIFPAYTQWQSTHQCCQCFD